MNMNTKIKSITFLTLAGIILAGCILVLPIWPIKFSDKILQDSVFQERKDEFQDLAKKLSQEFRFQLIDENRIRREWINDADAKKLYTTYKYQLAVKYGSVHGRKSILFNNKCYKTETSIYVFSSNLKSDLPYLVYDHKHSYAFIDPLKLIELKALAEKIAEEYAYSDHNPAKLSQIEQAVKNKKNAREMK